MQPQLERSQSMDTIRGFAVLGIFLMNVMGFGMPDSAYMNPAYYGGASGSDLWVWLVQDALFDGRMRSLFAMLFGAGMVMVYARALARNEGQWAQQLAWRHSWLAVFGLAHIFLLQCRGDILWPYALCGMVCWIFVTVPPARLLGIAVLAQALSTGIALHDDFSEQASYQEGQQLNLRQAEHKQLDDAEVETLTAWREQFESREAANWPKRASKTVDAMREGGWLTTFRAQQDELLEAIEITPGYLNLIALIVLGMALGKWGFFTARLSTRSYSAIAILGFLLVVPLANWLSRLWLAEGFSALPTPSGPWWTGTAATFRTIGALAWASLLILLLRGRRLRLPLTGFAAVGRMALSCYLLQTVVATLVFYGFGLGQFGQWTRTELAGFATLVWLLLIGFSVLWLRRFRFGPAEWLWRSLSYGTRQQMRL